MVDPISLTLMAATVQASKRIISSSCSDKTISSSEKSILESSSKEKDSFELSKLSAGFNLGILKGEAEFERRK